MIGRIARAYLLLLLSAEFVLFALSLLLHTGAFLGRRNLITEFGPFLFRCAVLVGILSVPFVKDSLRWTHQIKKSPEWMWKSALTIGVYVIVVMCLQLLLFPQGSTLTDQTLVVSGFPLAFDAISICILWTALRSDFFKSEELAKRAGISVAGIALSIVAFIAYRAGVWPPHPWPPSANE